MCLFDERTAGMTKLNYRSLASNVAGFQLPDLSRALTFWGYYSDSEPLIVCHKGPDGGFRGLPPDVRFTIVSNLVVSGNLPWVYSRQSLGGMILGPLWGIDLGGAATLHLYSLDLDDFTYSQIVQPPK